MPSAVRLAVAPLPPSPPSTAARATSPAGPSTAEKPKGKDSFVSTLSSLTTAIAAGDLEGAQRALDSAAGGRGPAYTRETPPGRGPASTPAHSNSRWNRQADFQDLVSAVRLGDLTASQQALEAFETKGRPAPPTTEAPVPSDDDTPAPAPDPVGTPAPEPVDTPETVGLVDATSPDAPDPGTVDIGALPPITDVDVESLPAPAPANAGDEAAQAA